MCEERVFVRETETEKEERERKVCETERERERVSKNAGDQAICFGACSCKG